MAGDVARRFHTETEHGVGRPAGGGPFDPRNEPAKVKRYPHLEGRPLPADWSPAAGSAPQVLSGRSSAGTGTSGVTDLARLLFLSHGVTRELRGRRFRAAPSAGALYPVEVYVVCGDLTGLPAGVYHHDPEDRILTPVREGDHRASLAAACADREVVRRPVSLVLTGIPWRTTWKYGPRGYRHLFWDAGAILANTLSAAASAGRPVRVTTAFVDAGVSDVLDLGDHLPFEEWPLAVVTLDDDGSQAPDAGPPGQPRHEVAELSAERVSWPEIGGVHHAGDLGDSGAVEAWREDLASLAPACMAVPAPPPLAEDGTTVDEVILRRGSTRRFDPDRTVPEGVLRWALPAALRSVPGDLDGGPNGGAPVGAHVVVHAVRDLLPGGYRWTRDGAQQVVADQTRATTAHLCLDQALGGDSAFTVFLDAPLDGILPVLGPRGYRVAHLAAGIAAGRLQLAAFASDLGGTGLTFYDDEVRRHFGTDADPLLVVAIGVPDYESTSGSRPRA